MKYPQEKFERNARREKIQEISDGKKLKKMPWKKAKKLPGKAKAR